MKKELKAKDEEYIKRFEKELSHMKNRYLARMKERNFAVADQIIGIIQLYKKELEDAKREYERDYGNSVHPSSPSGSKRVFTIKK